VRRFHPFIVNLTGGEPLLRRDLLQLIQRIKATGPVYLSLLTNGALLSGEKASKLRQAGLDGLSISLNYPGPEHDQERNIPGLFEHIREVIPQVKRAGFRRIDLNTVIMATNLGRLDELARLARSWGVGLCFSSYSAGKTGSDERGDLDLEQLDETIQRMRRLKREGWPIECSDFYMENVPRYFREGGVPNCRAGQRTIHVTPDGMVKPCPDLPPVAHFSRYETRNQPPVTCTSCWYRCRGESEVPIKPSWLLYVAGQYLKRTDRDTNGGR
jgi:MoaA/NifB/PqqE/SkfB family radical SAM enzyme